MDQAIKAQWIAALRSGEYAQTTGRLRRDEGYCCLGVLCDLAEKAGVVTGVSEDNYAGNANHWRYDDEVSVLPPVVQRWAGLSYENPTVRGAAGDHASSLAGENDNGADFRAIADIIDAQL